jgi:hypothetical protein
MKRNKIKLILKKIKPKIIINKKIFKKIFNNKK